MGYGGIFAGAASHCMQCRLEFSVHKVIYVFASTIGHEYLIAVAMEFVACPYRVVRYQRNDPDIGCHIFKRYFNGVVITYDRYILHRYLSASHKAERCTNNRKGFLHINWFNQVDSIVLMSCLPEHREPGW